MSEPGLDLSDQIFDDAIRFCNSAVEVSQLTRLDGVSEAFIPDDSGDREVGLLVSNVLTVLRRSAESAIATARGFGDDVLAVRVSFSDVDTQLAAENKLELSSRAVRKIT